MKGLSRIQPKFVDFIAEHLDVGVLYISRRYATASHLCCGCGHEVVTPLNAAKGVPTVGFWPQRHDPDGRDISHRSWLCTLRFLSAAASFGSSLDRLVGRRRIARSKSPLPARGVIAAEVGGDRLVEVGDRPELELVSHARSPDVTQLKSTMPKLSRSRRHD
jgi:hypothetical protein